MVLFFQSVHILNFHAFNFLLDIFLFSSFTSEDSLRICRLQLYSAVLSARLGLAGAAPGGPAAITGFSEVLEKKETVLLSVD